MLKDFSIEYAHIYTNQHVSDEHEISVKALGELYKELKLKRSKSSLVVMVDDYSFPDPSFDYTGFLSWLESQGFKPDFMIRESQLVPVCDETLRLISDMKLKGRISDYTRAKKYPCSMFIASWYLMRLGKISSLLIPDRVIAKEVINILPQSFKPFEDQALEIIAATPYKDCVEKIHYRFFEGRLIV